ncbi:MAG: hypothetical protein RIC35_03915 [Marinoscillum sp.]
MKDKHQSGPEDEFLKGIFKQSATEPSSALKAQIMMQVQSTSTMTAYKPVIGKKAWIILASCFVSAMCYFLYKVNETTFSEMEISLPDFTFLTEWSFTSQRFISLFDFALPSIPLSMATATAVLVVFGVYFMIGFKTNLFSASK